MHRAFSLKSPLPWLLVLGACLAASCDEKGITSICPPLPLYQSYPLGDASPEDASSADGGSAEAAYAAAVDAGCATPRTQFTYDGGDAGAGGVSASGGHSGAHAGGSSGAHAGGTSGASRGGSASDSAGAAGSD